MHPFGGITLIKKNDIFSKHPLRIASPRHQDVAPPLHLPYTLLECHVDISGLTWYRELSLDENAVAE